MECQCNEECPKCDPTATHQSIPNDSLLSAPKRWAVSSPSMVTREPSSPRGRTNPITLSPRRSQNRSEQQSVSPTSNTKLAPLKDPPEGPTATSAPTTPITPTWKPKREKSSLSPPSTSRHPPQLKLGGSRMKNTPAPRARLLRARPLTSPEERLPNLPSPPSDSIIHLSRSLHSSPSDLSTQNPTFPPPPPFSSPPLPLVQASSLPDAEPPRSLKHSRADRRVRRTSSTRTPRVSGIRRSRSTGSKNRLSPRRPTRRSSHITHRIHTSPTTSPTASPSNSSPNSPRGGSVPDLPPLSLSPRPPSPKSARTSPRSLRSSSPSSYRTSSSSRLPRSARSSFFKRSKTNRDKRNECVIKVELPNGLIVSHSVVDPMQTLYELALSLCVEADFDLELLTVCDSAESEIFFSKRIRVFDFQGDEIKLVLKESVPSIPTSIDIGMKLIVVLPNGKSAQVPLKNCSSLEGLCNSLSYSFPRARLQDIAVRDGLGADVSFPVSLLVSKVYVVYREDTLLLWFPSGGAVQVPVVPTQTMSQAITAPCALHQIAIPQVRLKDKNGKFFDYSQPMGICNGDELFVKVSKKIGKKRKLSTPTALAPPLRFLSISYLGRSATKSYTEPSILFDVLTSFMSLRNDSLSKYIIMDSDGAEVHSSVMMHSLAGKSITLQLRGEGQQEPSLLPARTLLPSSSSSSSSKEHDTPVLKTAIPSLGFSSPSEEIETRSRSSPTPPIPDTFPSSPRYHPPPSISVPPSLDGNTPPSIVPLAALPLDLLPPSLPRPSKTFDESSGASHGESPARLSVADVKRRNVLREACVRRGLLFRDVESSILLLADHFCLQGPDDIVLDAETKEFLYIDKEDDEKMESTFRSSNRWI